MRLERERVHDEPVGVVRGLGEEDARARVAVRLGEEQRAVRAVRALLRRLRLRRKGRRVLGISEREVVLLHGDDVREVGAELEGELELEPIHALVADRDPLLEPGSDEPAAGDRERVARKSVQRRVAQVEGGREVLKAARRERQRSGAVDP